MGKVGRGKTGRRAVALELAVLFAVALVAGPGSGSGGFPEAMAQDAAIVPTDNATTAAAPVEGYALASLWLDRPDETRFGALTFVGGLALSSRNPDFGALSGLRLPDGLAMTAVSDTGFWFSGRLQRDANGRPTGVENGRIAPLRDGEGGAILQKWAADIEGVTFDGNSVFISTEQDSRVLMFRWEDGVPVGFGGLFGPPLPAPRLSYSFGLEAVATLPAAHAARQDGVRLVAISEGEPNRSDPIRGFLIGEQSIAEFQVVRSGRYLVTDADFLPSGDLLLLERHFSPVAGSHMRIRRIAGSAIVPGALLDGETLVELGPRHQIDNMEGITAFRMPDGTVRIGLVSDNNQWMLQRTLYLEFAYPGAD